MKCLFTQRFDFASRDRRTCQAERAVEIITYVSFLSSHTACYTRLDVFSHTLPSLALSLSSIPDDLQL